MIIYGINLSTVDLWLLGICGALISVLITSFALHRYNAFCSAAAVFRNKVLMELAGLYPTQTKWPESSIPIPSILCEKHPRIETAVIEFRNYLNWLKRKRFDKAWHEYSKDYYEYVPIQSTSYSSDGAIIESESIDTTKTYYSLFKHNIDNLLKYAKPK